MFLLACTAVVDTAVESTDSAEVQVEGVGDAPAVALTMEPAGGTFTGSVELSLSLEGADVEVYYTLDGSEPNERDELYEGPFEVDGSVTVRARAVSPAREPVGPTVSQTYVRVGAELADFDSKLPLLVLSSDWNLPDEKRDSHTPFALQVFEPGGERVSVNDPAPASGAQVEHDGQTECSGEPTFEEISWPQDSAPGRYNAYAFVWDSCGYDGELEWTVAFSRYDRLLSVWGGRILTPPEGLDGDLIDLTWIEID